MLLLPAAMLVRRPPARCQPTLNRASPPMAPGMSVAQALRSPQFMVLGLTFFACCAAHSGPIFHMVSYAIVCGIAPMAAVSIYSVEGLAGLGGRLLFGVLADRLGVKPVLIAGPYWCRRSRSAPISFVSQLGEFYALAVIFGTAYGGVMPLYAVLAREYFGQHIMGTVFGAATMLSSLGMAFGPLAGGWIFDTFGGYSWLFIGSSPSGSARSQSRSLSRRCRASDCSQHEQCSGPERTYLATVLPFHRAIVPALFAQAVVNEWVNKTAARLRMA